MENIFHDYRKKAEREKKRERREEGKWGRTGVKLSKKVEERKGKR